MSDAAISRRLITVSGYARISGRPESTVRARIRRGLIRPVIDKPIALLAEEDAERDRDERRRARQDEAHVA